MALSIQTFLSNTFASGYSGFSGAGGGGGGSGAGISGFSGVSGFSGAGSSGFSGYSGSDGASGVSGFSGAGTSGFSGLSGFSGEGTSGYSGFSGEGTSGYSGYSGDIGTSGFSGYTGISGFSGSDGVSGFSGVSGYSGAAFVGSSGFSGYSGESGFSGVSGFSGAGTSGFSGVSGFSGPAGGPPGTSGFSGFSGAVGANSISYSVYFDGTGDYLTVPSSADFQFGTGDVTIELWFNLTANAALDPNNNRTASLITSEVSTPTTGWLFDLVGDSTTTGTSIKFQARNSGVLTDVNYITIVTKNVWHHVAFVRSGNTASLYYDGVRVTYDTNFTAVITSSSAVRIAGLAITSYPRNFPGYLSNVRVVKGSAVYSGATITVPTAPLALISNTVLLVCQRDVFQDVTAVGNSAISDFNPFGQTIGTSGYSGISGFSGASFIGSSGFSGFSGTSGFSGAGTSGFSGVSGFSGAGGLGESGYSGVSGFSGASFVGSSGFSGETGVSGYSGDSGYSGISGFSGISGYSGVTPDLTSYVTLTGTQTLTNKTYTGLKETRVVMAANDVDVSLGNFFTKTISTTTTFTVSNVPATDTAVSFIMELTNAGSQTINWFTGTTWASGSAPTLTTSGVDVLGFYSFNNGTTWRGLLLAKDIK